MSERRDSRRSRSRDRQHREESHRDRNSGRDRDRDRSPHRSTDDKDRKESHRDRHSRDRETRPRSRERRDRDRDYDRDHHRHRDRSKDRSRNKDSDRKREGDGESRELSGEALQEHYSKYASKRCNAPCINDEDYYNKNTEFSVWLPQAHGKTFSELSSSRAKELFREFARAWNKGKLSGEYFSFIFTCRHTNVNCLSNLCHSLSLFHCRGHV